MQNAALHIVQTLQKAGHTAYFAGGAVRDFLLGKDPEDIDIATSALPETIEQLFQKTFAIGKKFGVILVEEKGHHFEIATFRSDTGYSDGRRPDAVFFTDAKEDALRRDFTINGLFYDPLKKKIYDFVGGQQDLTHNILRFIGNPQHRIQEDHLRILRAVRFKNRFHLQFDPQTKEALIKHAHLISKVAPERIRAELTKMLTHQSRKQAFTDLFELKILETLTPELTAFKNTPQPHNSHAQGDVLTHSLLVIDKLPNNPSEELAWGALFHDLGKASTMVATSERIHYPKHSEEGVRIAKKILQRLKFSKFSISKICWLIGHHLLFDNWKEMKWSTRLHYFDHPFFEDLLHLHQADLFGCIPTHPQLHIAGEQHLQHIREEYQRAHFDNLLPSAQPEFLSGEEIMQILNIPEGKQVGEMKRLLREVQLEGTVQTKKAAKKWIREKFDTSGVSSECLFYS